LYFLETRGVESELYISQNSQEPPLVCGIVHPRWFSAWHSVPRRVVTRRAGAVVESVECQSRFILRPRRARYSSRRVLALLRAGHGSRWCQSRSVRCARTFLVCRPDHIIPIIHPFSRRDFRHRKICQSRSAHVRGRAVASFNTARNVAQCDERSERWSWRVSRVTTWLYWRSTWDCSTRDARHDGQRGGCGSCEHQRCGFRRFSQLGGLFRRVLLYFVSFRFIYTFESVCFICAL